MKPLEGIRILAVSQYGAGPFAMLHLADLGAEVIKIEDPGSGGDVSRHVIPYAEDGDSLYFQSLNRNKKSLSLNLKSAEGQAIFRRLAAKSHAVFNNLRGDVPAKLGLTYEALKEVNPRLVTCSLSGFGTSGSMRAEPAYDYLLQAMLGHMALTGDPCGPPEKYGVSMIDFSTGTMAALALMVGLFQATARGVGCDLDVSLFDTAASMLNYLAAWNLNEGYTPRKTRHSAHPSLVPSQLFSTRDGSLVVMCNKEKFFPLLCEALEIPEVARDPRFANFALRLDNKEALLEILNPVFATRTTAEWIARLNGTVPAAAVNTVDEAMKLPLLAERGMLVEADHPQRGKVRMLGTPIKVSTHTPTYERAPALGEQTDELLQTLLGMERTEIDDLRARGVL